MDTEAIVNAANTSLLGGGGVDGAIHRAAGHRLLDECISIGPCPTGEARITGGYNLISKYVIHTPGPIYKNGSPIEKKLLTLCYIHSMKIAADTHIKSISFPAISTGVYNYPKKEVAEIAINTVADFMLNNDYYPDIYFVLFDRENFVIYQSIIKSLK